MLGVFSALEVAASGLGAERIRMNTIASNLANARTTQVEGGGPYKRLDPVFQAIPLDRERGVIGADAGVSLVNVQQIKADDRPGMMVYEPGHPDANAAGYVEYPNVNPVTEMTDMLSASRAYEANVTVLNSIKQMAQRSIDLGRA